MGAWERSPFAIRSKDLDAEEALRAMQRLLLDAGLSEPVRESLEAAIRALREDRR